MPHFCLRIFGYHYHRLITQIHVRTCLYECLEKMYSIVLERHVLVGRLRNRFQDSVHFQHQQRAILSKVTAAKSVQRFSASSLASLY